MTYAIFDNGNLVVSFDREDEAREAFDRIAREASHPADLLMIAFDDDGGVIDEVDGVRAAAARP